MYPCRGWVGFAESKGKREVTGSSELLHCVDALIGGHFGAREIRSGVRCSVAVIAAAAACRRLWRTDRRTISKPFLDERGRLTAAAIRADDQLACGQVEVESAANRRHGVGSLCVTQVLPQVLAKERRGLRLGKAGSHRSGAPALKLQRLVVLAFFDERILLGFSLGVGLSRKARLRLSVLPASFLSGGGKLSFEPRRLCDDGRKRAMRAVVKVNFSVADFQFWHGGRLPSAMDAHSRVRSSPNPVTNQTRCRPDNGRYCSAMQQDSTARAAYFSDLAKKKAVGVGLQVVATAARNAVAAISAKTESGYLQEAAADALAVRSNVKLVAAIAGAVLDARGVVFAALVASMLDGFVRTAEVDGAAIGVDFSMSDDDKTALLGHPIVEATAEEQAQRLGDNLQWRLRAVSTRAAIGSLPIESLADELDAQVSAWADQVARLAADAWFAGATAARSALVSAIRAG